MPLLRSTQPRLFLFFQSLPYATALALIFTMMPSYSSTASCKTASLAKNISAVF